jgi:leucyl aminopeptidase
MDVLVDAAEGEAPSLPVTPVSVRDYQAWLDQQSSATAAWLRASGFTAKAGASALIPGADGGVEGAVLAVEQLGDIWSYAGLPSALPTGTYYLAADLDTQTAERAALGWALGAYAFDRYKRREDTPARLVLPAAASRARVERLVRATALVRDLINTPAGDMGPAELAEAVRAEGKRYGARTQVTSGDQLLKKNYPAIHAVGRASSREPCLIDMRWNANGGGPQLTLVGKGIVFDTGGLDLKNPQGMRLMKKDMGGAAHALALAKLVMDANLPVSLRVLIPAAENSVAGNAFRPGDVLNTRAGKTVEIGNTDAEGRLVLADALAAAEKDKPEVVIDFATLTGAARVALGPDVPALFCNDDALADRLTTASGREQDPLWRLPLHTGYRRWLDSDIADLTNVSDSPFAGAIIAGLFLQEFAPKGAAWAHFDVMAWNTTARPGRPKGGEAVALRAAFQAIRAWAESQGGS